MLTIFNKYKDTLRDLVDSSDIEPPNMLKLIDKRLCNIMPDFENPLIESGLDKNI